MGEFLVSLSLFPPITPLTSLTFGLSLQFGDRWIFLDEDGGYPLPELDLQKELEGEDEEEASLVEESTQEAREMEERMVGSGIIV